MKQLTAGPSPQNLLPRVTSKFFRTYSSVRSSLSHHLPYFAGTVPRLFAARPSGYCGFYVTRPLAIVGDFDSEAGRAVNAHQSESGSE
jgi:hypothetical protein